MILTRQRETPYSTPVSDETETIPSPEQLARQSRDGCLRSFESLVECFSDRIYNFLYKLTNNVHDAEDLTQETFVRAYKGLKNYDPGRPFSTWIFTIAKRRAATHYRASIKKTFMPEQEAVDTRNPARIVQAEEKTSSIWTLARRLKANQYQTLWLKYGEGFSVKEIAEVMQLNQVYVKVLLHRGRTNLADLIRKTRQSTSNDANWDLDFLGNPLQEKVDL